MQLSKPTQSIRSALREALLLQRWIRHCGGCFFRTYLSARFIAFFWSAMQRCCHWQLRPMLSVTGSYSGAGDRALAAAAHVINAAAQTIPFTPRRT